MSGEEEVEEGGRRANRPDRVQVEQRISVYSWQGWPVDTASPAIHLHSLPREQNLDFKLNHTALLFISLESCH